MNELEKKFSCLCGSEVKEANRKAHEKTKKHTNYQQTHGTSNLMPVHNLPVPKAVRKLQTKRKYDEVEEEDDNYEDDEEDPEHEQGDEEDDGFEEDLMQALDTIHQSIESLLVGQKQINKDLRESADNLLFNIKPLLTNVCDRMTRIEEECVMRFPLVCKTDEEKTNPQPKWINDKCTQRN
jgi:hypothetical protein